MSVCWRPAVSPAVADTPLAAAAARCMSCTAPWSDGADVISYLEHMVSWDAHELTVVVEYVTRKGFVTLATAMDCTRSSTSQQAGCVV